MSLLVLTWTSSFILEIAMCSSANTWVDLARFKPTQQSGTDDFVMLGITKAGNSSFAVDDFYNTNYTNVTCSKTEYVQRAWWMVDLLGYFTVRAVGIVTRKGNIVKNFKIETSVHWNESAADMVNPALCYQQQDSLSFNELETFYCQAAMTARYIRITKMSGANRTLALCLVRVFGFDTERHFVSRATPAEHANNRIIRTLTTPSILTCFALCFDELGCNSIAFQRQNKEENCELLSESPALQSRNDTTANGWMQYTFDSP